jgi:hypothetical protein
LLFQKISSNPFVINAIVATEESSIPNQAGYIIPKFSEKKVAAESSPMGLQINMIDIFLI